MKKENSTPKRKTLTIIQICNADKLFMPVLGSFSSGGVIVALILFFAAAIKSCVTKGFSQTPDELLAFTIDCFFRGLVAWVLCVVLGLLVAWAVMDTADKITKKGIEVDVEESDEEETKEGQPTLSGKIKNPPHGEP